jgi:hypothetical protein
MAWDDDTTRTRKQTDKTSRNETGWRRVGSQRPCITADQGSCSAQGRNAVHEHNSNGRQLSDGGDHALGWGCWNDLFMAGCKRRPRASSSCCPPMPGSPNMASGRRAGWGCTASPMGTVRAGGVRHLLHVFLRYFFSCSFVSVVARCRISSPRAKVNIQGPTCFYSVVHRHQLQ